MKKFLSIALILVMSLGLLAGCAGEPATPSGGGSDADFKVGFIFLHDENSTYDKKLYGCCKRGGKGMRSHGRPGAL